MELTRREVLTRGALLGGAAALIGATRRPGAALAASASRLPPPAASGVDHIVVLMMENRSFDHFLGWLPGADGRQAGLSYPDNNGVLHPTYHLSDYHGWPRLVPVK